MTLFSNGLYISKKQNGKTFRRESKNNWEARVKKDFSGETSNLDDI